MDFARNLAAYLESARVQGRFGQLAIVASPDLLGKLRKAMSRAVCETVIEEVCKDVTSCSVDNIQACLSVSARVVEGPAFNLH